MNEMPQTARLDMASAIEPVVILVDNKVRDLNVAALIAHHIESLGVTCHLEPLEAYRGVLAAYRPGMIVFNHLNAGHLVQWSQRLANMGVLTAVLPNEGIAYDPDVLQYLAGRYHRGAHVDYFFCWNDAHKAALIKQGFGKETRVEVTGVPRFDFYFEPWSCEIDQTADGSRPRVLVCTNFITAQLLEIPREYADSLFKQWAGRLPLYDDYWSAIEAQGRARRKVLDFLNVLLKADAFDIVLRPHPGEDSSFYVSWLEALPAEQRGQIRIDSHSDISSLILGCDLEISCETCTTALESWIAGKPTIELNFERHPLWYREVHARGNIPCEVPAVLAALVERELQTPGQPEKREIRRQHLEQWCASPDGRSSERIGRLIVEAVRSKNRATWSELGVHDYRRALKLKATHLIGEAYHYDPFLPIKQLLFRDQTIGRASVYQKSVKPQDVSAARARLSNISRRWTDTHPRDESSGQALRAVR